MLCQLLPLHAAVVLQALDAMKQNVSLVPWGLAAGLQPEIMPAFACRNEQQG
jgi:hypothetical protein